MLFFRSAFISACAVLFFSAEGMSQLPPVPVERLGTDTVIIQQAKKVSVNFIVIVGNKVTKRHIVLRELAFSEGDTLSPLLLSDKMKAARQNLLNTSLFNFVSIDTISAGPQMVDVMVNVAERWYTWPVPVFEIQERNFNTWWQTKNFDRANYGFFLERENFRGRKEDLSFYFQFGYTEKYGLTYKVPYLSRGRSTGAGLSFSYSRNREIAYATDSNKLVYFKDPNRYIREEFSGKAHVSYRKGIHNSHLLEVKYINANVDDTLRHYTTGYFTYDDMRTQFFILDYFFRKDHRDAKYYPLRGYYLELEATKIGFGLLDNENTDVLNLLLNLKKFQKLSNRFYAAGSLRVKYSTSVKQPYYVQKGLGWGDYVRGYEYYVIDAQRYGTAKLGLKYEIIKPRVSSIPLPLEKFNKFHYALYGGLFADGGYAEDYQSAGSNNVLANTLLYGYGAGIDFVTYYDMVFRFEYSFNKMKEHGFFVSFSAGI